MNSETANNLSVWCAPESAAWLSWRLRDHRHEVEDTSRPKARKIELSRRTADEPLKRRLEARQLLILLASSSRLPSYIELSASDKHVEQFLSSLRHASGGPIRQFFSGSRVTRAQAKQQLDGALVGALDSFMVRLGGEVGLSTSIELDAVRMGLLVDLVASRLGDLSEVDARRLSENLVSDLRESLMSGASIGTARGFISGSGRSLVAILRNAPQPNQVISEPSRWVPVDVRY